jgi:hypothetical protein
LSKTKKTEYQENVSANPKTAISTTINKSKCPCNRLKKCDQMYLDFGQASFGKRIQCIHCGTLYVEGVPEDCQAHERVCRDYRHGVRLRMTPALQACKDVLPVMLGSTKAFIVEVSMHL